MARRIGEIMEQAEAEVVAAAQTTARTPARESLDREMREIKDDVLRMGSLVEEALRGAIGALVSHDAEAATRVIVGDERINEMQRGIAGAITRTIATQSPVARDLRFLMALDHVTYELERMGDHAGSVAKQARKLAPLPPLKRYVDLPAMGELVALQVHAILRALVEVHEAAAREVAAGDQQVDRLYRAIFDELLELMRADPANVDWRIEKAYAAQNRAAPPTSWRSSQRP
jgi:phosphate transport system protein